MTPELQQALQNLKIPSDGSHKGQNGKLLLIGGSDLFHAASRWSLDIASHFVDMVFYASVPSNNELVQEAKGEFWNGIVIRREDVEAYAQEADCILIGPGMTRSSETENITNTLVEKFSQKKWVIDAGALQMISPKLLNKNMILTPHPRELAMLVSKLGAIDQHTEATTQKLEEYLRELSESDVEKQLQSWSKQLGGAMIILKGKVDVIATSSSATRVEGGNAGMTKGGTGDVLAGLIAALACTNELDTAALVGCHINKTASDELFKTMGPFFNSSELVDIIPQTLWAAISAEKIFELV